MNIERIYQATRATSPKTIKSISTLVLAKQLVEGWENLAYERMVQVLHNPNWFSMDEKDLATQIWENKRDTLADFRDALNSRIRTTSNPNLSRIQARRLSHAKVRIIKRIIAQRFDMEHHCWRFPIGEDREIIFG